MPCASKKKKCLIVFHLEYCRGERRSSKRVSCCGRRCNTISREGLEWLLLQSQAAVPAPGSSWSTAEDKTRNILLKFCKWAWEREGRRVCVGHLQEEKRKFSP